MDGRTSTKRSGKKRVVTDRLKKSQRKPKKLSVKPRSTNSSRRSGLVSDPSSPDVCDSDILHEGVDSDSSTQRNKKQKPPRLKQSNKRSKKKSPAGLSAGSQTRLPSAIHSGALVSMISNSHQDISSDEQNITGNRNDIDCLAQSVSSASLSVSRSSSRSNSNKREHSPPKNELEALMLRQDFDESIRWDYQLNDPELEEERMKYYKINRRKRYLKAAQAQGVRLSCSSSANCSVVGSAKERTDVAPNNNLIPDLIKTGLPNIGAKNRYSELLVNY
ncbi:uncharacterized protein LOC106152087 [Lingula anatina]|uniref:Uncharacterized protein LOC106152087 n=1 Tax=Lingula anatina TaxID=7574 RepID=A0A1S3H6C4_LINAN|nr:uncharacterized protein LOC106152087 [Lingula anatina]|eukprot:XP_013381031.1 uncharacterized protein LOC106152087 [Lingula anatina]